MNDCRRCWHSYILNFVNLRHFRTATKSEIIKAYRNMAREWHPDKFEGEDKEMAQKKFIDIAAAKEVLTDPGEAFVRCTLHTVQCFV